MKVDSLHALEAALANTDVQRTAGVKSISVSQLSRKNNNLDPVILSNIFLQLVSLINGKKMPSPNGMPLKVIDSSTLPLNVNHFKWAKFRKTKSGVKLHLRLVFDERGTHYPDKEIITNAKESDRSQLEVLVDDKEAMYVFDRGYMDYGRFDAFTDEGLFFVSRLKKNSVVRLVERFALAFVVIPFQIRWPLSETRQIVRKTSFGLWSYRMAKAGNCALSPTVSTYLQRKSVTSIGHGGPSNCSSNGSSST
nr:transposase [Planococcus lenghuensis]